jgi:hypothetical protein
MFSLPSILVITRASGAVEGKGREEEEENDQLKRAFLWTIAFSVSC